MFPRIEEWANRGPGLILAFADWRALVWEYSPVAGGGTFQEWRPTAVYKYNESVNIRSAKVWPPIWAQ